MNISLPAHTDALTPTERVAAAYAQIKRVDRPEIWITVRPHEDVVAEAHRLEQRLAAGDDLLLAGTLVAIKDNIDVAGLPTTAACPEFAATPAVSAVTVERLTTAGAIVIGKTNLDQFATGLVGTRSPHGAVRNATHPDYISGGSSSGSAVAVALEIVDIALGTDTAGSGRVPAALNGIVGIKPTLGLLPNHGVVPACVDYDTVTVFARTVPAATAALATMIGPDPRDPRSRALPADMPMAAPERPHLAIPLGHQLEPLTPAYQHAWERTLHQAQDAGCTTEKVDVHQLLDAALLLYDGAIVAERYAAVGTFIDADRDRKGLDPTVTAIITAAADKNAAAFANDLDTLHHAAGHARAILDRFDGILLPTTTEHPTITDINAEPVAINRRMGTYTNFCNLLDLSAVAIPGVPTAAGMPFGVMLIEHAFADQVGLDIATRIATATHPESAGDVTLPAATTGAAHLVVFGAHRRGAALHHELQAINARYLGDIDTTDAYKLYALNTTPIKPGLVRVGPGEGQPINGELYAVSPAGLGTFLAALPAPMALTAVELADGRTVTGFTCTHEATAGAEDITDHRNWLTYLAAQK